MQSTVPSVHYFQCKVCIFILHARIFVNFQQIMINQGEYSSVTLFSIANVYYINVSYKVFRSYIGVSSCVSIIVQVRRKS